MKNLQFNLLTLLVLLFLVSSCEKQAVPNQTTPIQEDLSDNSGILTEESLPYDAHSDADMNDPIESIATIKLKNGNTLDFFAIEGAESGAFILEDSDCAGCSALSDFAAIDETVNPYAAFWAYSEPGTPIPAQLKNLYQKNQISQQQGWMRDKLSVKPSNTDKSGNIACNNSSFMSGYPSNADYIRLDKKPVSYAGFTNDCFNPTASGSCWGNPRKKLRATYNNLRSWRGKICAKNVEAFYNRHNVSWCGPGCSVDPGCNLPGSCSIYQGPQMSFQIKIGGLWRNIRSGNQYATYEVQANQTRVKSWSANWSQNTSFRIEVRYAKLHDEFDLMMDK